MIDLYSYYSCALNIDGINIKTNISRSVDTGEHIYDKLTKRLIIQMLNKNQTLIKTRIFMLSIRNPEFDSNPILKCQDFCKNARCLHDILTVGVPVISGHREARKREKVGTYNAGMSNLGFPRCSCYTTRNDF